jgi:hypothetical protein
MTLLGELMNRQLEDVLHRLGLRIGGSKTERMERLIAHFSGDEIGSRREDAVTSSASTMHAATEPLDSQVRHNQVLFWQKASNPYTSLQPWLEQLLDGGGRIRCYATEDENPTKQLKNKLSQAAAAQDGLLVLTLADEKSYLKAREALLERWMTNPEWSKSIACVALAYPLANPNITSMIERVTSHWTQAIRSTLFPSAEVLKATGNDDSVVSETVDVTCGRCNAPLPVAAKYCPNCGTQVV